jgi:ElaB/YqjD/DUF883 family membrane-anchored ribosome-binding protein
MMASVKDLEAELEQARADIAALASLAADRGSERAHGVSDAVQAMLGELSDEGRAAFEKARAEGTKLRGRAVEEVRTHPLSAVALGVAAGAVLALILRR